MIFVGFAITSYHGNFISIFSSTSDLKSTDEQQALAEHELEETVRDLADFEDAINSFVTSQAASIL